MGGGDENIPSSINYLKGRLASCFTGKKLNQPSNMRSSGGGGFSSAYFSNGLPIMETILHVLPSIPNAAIDKTADSDPPGDTKQVPFCNTC